MIAFDKRGGVLAIHDGAEILLHDADSGRPLWRKTLDGPICGLAADSKTVVAVTALGTVTWFDARTGVEQRTATLSGGKVQTALVDGALQRVVAIMADSIVALDGSGTTTLATQGARAIALRPDGTVLAAPSTGSLVLIASDGAQTTKPYDGPAIHALAWHPEGFWVLGTKSKLYRWAADAPAPVHITNLPGDATLDYVTCSDRAIAVGWDRDMVLTMEWPSRETLASVRYPERKVLGIDFGPWPWIGICLDLGDANMQTLDEAALHRTDTHPGREHHRWLVITGGSSKPAVEKAPPAVREPASSYVRWLVIAAIAAIAAYFALRR
jgi:hypothetical protein